MEEEKPKHILCMKCFNVYIGLQSDAKLLDSVEKNISCPFTIH